MPRQEQDGQRVPTQHRHLPRPRLTANRHGLPRHQQDMLPPVVFKRHTPLEPHFRRLRQHRQLPFVEMER